MYHYEDLKEIYKKSNSKTRNKSIQLPKTIKAVSNKNSYMVALKTLVCKYTYIVPALVQVVISTSLGLRFVIICKHIQILYSSSHTRFSICNGSLNFNLIKSFISFLLLTI